MINYCDLKESSKTLLYCNIYFLNTCASTVSAYCKQFSLTTKNTTYIA